MKRTFCRAATGVLVSVAVLTSAACSGELSASREAGSEEGTGESLAAVSQNSQGLAVVKLDERTQQRIGLQTSELREATFEPEVPAYGRLETDPSRLFVVRVPTAGTLRKHTPRDWPGLGDRISDGDVVGAIDPRLTPVDRISLSERLATARADLAAASVGREAAQAAYRRIEILNADNKNASDRALQEAKARLKTEEAREGAARETVQLFEASLQTGAVPARSSSLLAEHGGEVVEVLAQPGETVEAGQPVLRIARFDELLARIQVPAGQVLPSVTRTARIAALGHEDTPLSGKRVALAAAVDPNTQTQAFLFRISNPNLALRPGLAVTGYFRVQGKPRRGFLIARSAVIRAAGKAWVYVQEDLERFVRHEVSTEYLPGGEVFVTGGLDGSRRIVTVGAQVLLSEESKSQIEVEEER